MNIQRILFPTDFSEYNSAALRYASSLASEAGAKLYIVHVDERTELAAAMGGYPYATPWETEEQQKVRDRLTRLVPTVAGVAFEHRYLEGSPVAQLLRFAERENIDLIVMGSHGRTGLARLVMGSIAEGVMRQAKCPVLVVKQPASESEHVERGLSSALESG